MNSCAEPLVYDSQLLADGSLENVLNVTGGGPTIQGIPNPVAYNQYRWAWPGDEWDVYFPFNPGFMVVDSTHYDAETTTGWLMTQDDPARSRTGIASLEHVGPEFVTDRFAIVSGVLCSPPVNELNPFFGNYTAIVSPGDSLDVSLWAIVTDGSTQMEIQRFFYDSDSNQWD